MTAIFSQDEEKLYNLFSPINRDNCDIESQIKEMFDSIPVGSFDLSFIENKADGGGTSYDGGRITKHSFGCKCDKIFDEEGYEIVEEYTIEDITLYYKSY